MIIEMLHRYLIKYNRKTKRGLREGKYVTKNAEQRLELTYFSCGYLRWSENKEKVRGPVWPWCGFFFYLLTDGGFCLFDLPHVLVPPAVHREAVKEMELHGLWGAPAQ